MITCDTKQIALDIGQCPSRKSRVRGGELGEGGQYWNLWVFSSPLSMNDTRYGMVGLSCYVLPPIAEKLIGYTKEIDWKHLSF
jgi:hypothetical protein